MRVSEDELSLLDELLLSRFDDTAEVDLGDEGITDVTELDGFLTAIVSVPVTILPKRKNSSSRSRPACAPCTPTGWGGGRTLSNPGRCRSGATRRVLAAMTLAPAAAARSTRNAANILATQKIVRPE
jgi:hypothetical protein